MADQALIEKFRIAFGAQTYEEEAREPGSMYLNQRDAFLFDNPDFTASRFDQVVEDMVRQGYFMRAGDTLKLTPAGHELAESHSEPIMEILRSELLRPVRTGKMVLDNSVSKSLGELLKLDFTSVAFEPKSQQLLDALADKLRPRTQDSWVGRNDARTHEQGWSIGGS